MGVTLYILRAEFLSDGSLCLFALFHPPKERERKIVLHAVDVRAHLFLLPAEMAIAGNAHVCVCAQKRIERGET